LLNGLVKDSTAPALNAWMRIFLSPCAATEDRWSDEDGWDLTIVGVQLLQFEARYSRHTDVHDQACRLAVWR
jgi:hypothetical protein